jgi:polycomb protein SCMH1
MSQNANISPQSTNKVRGRKKLASPSTQACTWCAEHKTHLKYVLPNQNGKKEFCSESCIAEFRKNTSKGACVQCDNVIRANAPNREYCSTFCMNKHQKKTASPSASSPAAAVATSSNGTKTGNSLKLLGENNNNNNHSKDISNSRKSPAPNRVSPVTTSTGGPFQYESFHVFNWDEYLKVSDSFGNFPLHK